MINPLLVSIVAPWLIAALLLMLPGASKRAIRFLGLVGFTAPALMAFWVSGYGEALSSGAYTFLQSWDTGLQSWGIHLTLGVNGITFPLYLMAGIVGLAAGMQACFSSVPRLKGYLVLLLIMHGGLMGVFCSVDLFFFYFFHELALLTTFLMIGLWGGHWRKLVAMDVTIYLSAGALLTLVGFIILYVQMEAPSFDLITLRSALKSSDAQTPLFGLLALGLGILVSLFPFHSWAPRAYTTMPTATAMLHAGVLKKFGLLGLIQVAYPLLPQGALAWNSWMIALALGNILIIGLVTLAQQDLKKMIAYSSVMHMGYAFLGLTCFSCLGTTGAILMLFGHGLSVALLFLLAECLKKRCGSYAFVHMGGLAASMPWLCSLFVVATLASIGLPGFAGFWGELALFSALWQNHPWASVGAVFGIVISATYGLTAVARIFFGPQSTPKHFKDLYFWERLPAFLLLTALVSVGIFPKTLCTYLTYACTMDRK